MNIFRGFDAVEHPFSNAVVAVGSFDGVHRGHQMLFEQMTQTAAQRNGKMVVVTFEPHPRQVLRGDNRLLSTLDEKLILMDEARVENVVVVNFTQAFAALKGEDFLRDYLIAKLGMRTVFAGRGHHYGCDRQQGQELYERYGIEWKVLERLENISSTMIRDLLIEGQVARAEALLGRAYLVMEPVTDPSKIIPPITNAANGKTNL